MVPNRFALALVAASCVTAAGAGSYVATRQNLATAPPATTTESVAAAAPVATATESPAVAASLVATPANDPSAAVETPVNAAPAKRPTPRILPSTERRNDAPAEMPRVTDAVAPAAAPEPVPATEPPLVADAAPAPDVREPEPAPEPVPAKTFEELRIAAEAVIGLQSETSVNSERAKIEDRVEARVVRDVMVDGFVAIPAGTRVLGTVTVVDRGGKFRERARLGIRFNTLLFGDGTRVPIATDTIYRYGDSPSDKSAAKIGGATAAGAILGAIIGGSKGAAIGATTGAGAGTAAVMAGKAGAATFPAGVEVTARLTSPVSVTVERE